MGKVIEQGTSWQDGYRKSGNNNHHVMYETVWNPAKQWGKLPYLPINWCGGFLSTINRHIVWKFGPKMSWDSLRRSWSSPSDSDSLHGLKSASPAGKDTRRYGICRVGSVLTPGSPMKAKSSPASGLHVGDFFYWPCQIQKQTGARRLVKLGMMKIHHWFNQHLVITAWAEFPVETLCWIYDRIFALRKSYVGPMKSSS